jgi:alcohol dehydrogenase
VLVGASALQALNEHIKLQAGQKIFIHGGAGGIGTVAIQVAKHIGAYVATTATGSGVDTVAALGADEVIDYKAEDFESKLHEYDAVFDTVGGDDFAKSLRILKKGGVAVTMAAQVDEAQATELGVTAIGQMTSTTTEVLGKLRELVESGVVTAHIDKTFPLNEIVEAFIAKETGSVNGKVVITVL